MNDQNMPDYESFFAGGASNHPEGDHLEMIPLSRLKDFRNHTYDVENDDDMQEIVESIKMIGQVEPIVVRPSGRNSYEIISGHRRTYACMLAGLTEVEAVIRDNGKVKTEAHATISMADANLKRNPKPSELARTYRAKQEAVRQLPGNTGEQVAFGTKKSRATIYRYLKIAELIPELLKKVDQKRINLVAGGTLAELSLESQMVLNTYLETNPRTRITPAKASALTELPEEEFTEEAIECVINPLKKVELKDQQEDELAETIVKEQASKVAKAEYDFPPEIKKLFPENTSFEDMQRKIIEALSHHETVTLDGAFSKNR